MMRIYYNHLYLLRNFKKNGARSWAHTLPIQRRGLRSLQDRGTLHQILPSMDMSQLATHVSRSRSVYCGIDPTSDSLHIGHLLPIMLLIHLQKRGLVPITVLGDVTAYIGDPSGRTTMREPISEQDIENNCIRIENSLRNLFNNYKAHFHNNDSLPQLQLIRNSSWYNKINVIHFLSTIGRSFRLENMLSRKCVQQRLANSVGMSLAEFKYEMFQAFDWCKLFEMYGCHIQIGGLDQIDNINSGRGLISSIYGDNSIGLITPSIVAESGDKYGKSGGSPVWLSSDKTSEYDLYQFFLRMADNQSMKLLPILTFADDEELRDLIERHQACPERRLCQERLAKDITILVHGKEGLDLALKATELFFGDASVILHKMNKFDFEQIFTTVSFIEISRDVLNDPNIDLVSLSMTAKLFPTEQDAKRIIASGGLYLNMRRVLSIPENLVLPAGVTLARVGKKNYTLLKWL